MQESHSSIPECEFIVEFFFQGKRIETFLGKHLRNWSPWLLQRMIKSGCVRVNDTPTDCNYRVQPGETVRIKLICPPDRVAVAEPLPLEVLHEDPWIIVVSKPPGQIAHPGGDYTGQTLLNVLQHHLNQQTKLPGMIRPGIVHRIDRQTSGVMVIPKNHLAHRKLTSQFEKRQVSKKYLAIVHGRLSDDSGVIDLPIGKVPNPSCTLVSAKPIAVAPRSARTSYRVLERFENYTFVEARPLTGRHHQIRIHFAESGHALLADQFYGQFGVLKDGTLIELPEWYNPNSGAPQPLGPIVEPFYDPALPLRRHALHAATLSIDHPITGQPFTFEAPLPQDMVETLNALRPV